MSSMELESVENSANGNDISPEILRNQNIYIRSGDLRTSREYRSLDHNTRETKSNSPSSSQAKIVLKFTTVSEGCNEAPSFTVTDLGAKIGSGVNNEIYVPSDIRLAAENHAMITYSNGSFYLSDGGYDHAASIRIGVGTSHKFLWYLERGARFSAGNSIFVSEGIDSNGFLALTIIDGPLKGDSRTITRKGATFGRSSENDFSIPDRELSRKHSRIEFDERVGKYLVCDVGSTNGTYMQLVSFECSQVF